MRNFFNPYRDAHDILLDHFNTNYAHDWWMIEPRFTVYHAKYPLQGFYDEVS